MWECITVWFVYSLVRKATVLTGCGQSDRVDARLSTTEIRADVQAGGGSAEVRRPAESSRAAFISLIQL